MNKYINIFKKNKKLLFPIAALVIVFGYSMVSDFFSTGPSVSSGEKYVGSIDYGEDSNATITKEQKSKANSRITDSDEQRKLLAEEELAAKERADNEDGFYMKKELLFDEDKDNRLIIGEFNDNSGLGLDNNLNPNEIPENCEKDLITNVVICEENGKKYILVDGKKFFLSEELCSESPYNLLTDCETLLKEKEEERAREEEARKKIEEAANANIPDMDLMNNDVTGTSGRKSMLGDNLPNNTNNRGGNRANYSGEGKEDEETFGVDPNSVGFLKNSAILSLINNANTKKSGAFYSSNDSYNSLNSNVSPSKSQNINKPTFMIKPGSTYLAKVLNPTNSLYSSQVRPVMDITSGDLKGYRLVGEISYAEGAEGVIITGSEVVSPSGEKYQVDFTAMRYNKNELTPMFADEIDRHLGARIGYSVLGALTSDYAGMLATNSVKDTIKVNPGETTAERSGEIISQTFSDIASQYKTEIKVNPQNVIVIFY